jgi:hypothetical protein
MPCSAFNACPLPPRMQGRNTFSGAAEIIIGPGDLKLVVEFVPAIAEPHQ